MAQRPDDQRKAMWANIKQAGLGYYRAARGAGAKAVQHVGAVPRAFRDAVGAGASSVGDYVSSIDPRDVGGYAAMLTVGAVEGMLKTAIDHQTNYWEDQVASQMEALEKKVGRGVAKRVAEAQTAVTRRPNPYLNMEPKFAYSRLDPVTGKKKLRQPFANEQFRRDMMKQLGGLKEQINAAAVMNQFGMMQLPMNLEQAREIENLRARLRQYERTHGPIKGKFTTR